MEAGAESYSLFAFHATLGFLTAMVTFRNFTQSPSQKDESYTMLVCSSFLSSDRFSDWSQFCLVVGVN